MHTTGQQLTILLSSSLWISIIKHRNHWFFIVLQMTLYFVTKLYIYDTWVWTYSMDVKCNLKMYGNIQFNHKGIICVSSASSSFKHISNSHVPPRERGSPALFATLTWQQWNHHDSHTASTINISLKPHRKELPQNLCSILDSSKFLTSACCDICIARWIQIPWFAWTIPSTQQQHLQRPKLDTNRCYFIFSRGSASTLEAMDSRIIQLATFSKVISLQLELLYSTRHYNI